MTPPWIAMLLKPFRPLMREVSAGDGQFKTKVKDVLGDRELVEGRDVAVEHGRRPRSQGTILVAVERAREDRRQEEQAHDDAGVACGDRPAAVHGLR